MGDLTKHFSAHEFKCPCGKCTGGTMNIAFLTKLDQLRELFGKPIRIESGFRCAAHNKAVGGTSESMHLQGRAADLIVESDADRYHLHRVAFSLFAGVGTAKGTIHVDDRNQAVARSWTYYK